MINLLNTSKQSIPFCHINAKVEGLSNYDMIYVYHLLSKNTKLSIKKQGDTLEGGAIYAVYFSSFKLGYITLNGLSQLVITDQSNIEVYISKITKENYLPIKSLEVLLVATSLKKAS